ELFADRGRDCAPDHVDAAAGRERNDHVDRARRPILRVRIKGDENERHRRYEPALAGHASLPCSVRRFGLAQAAALLSQLSCAGSGTSSRALQPNFYLIGISPRSQPSRAVAQKSANVPAEIAARIPAISS